MKLAIAAFLSRLKGSRFRRNAFLLVRANVITQVLLVLATPVLTRLFSPEDFGVAGLFMVASAFFVAAASFRFDWSIPSAESEEDALVLLAASLGLIAVLSLALAAVLTLGDADMMLGLFGMEPLPFAPLIAVLGFASGAAAVLSSANIRSGEMQHVSHSRYAQSSTQLASSLLTGLAGMGAFGLVLSYTIGALAALVPLFRHTSRALWLHFVGFTRWRPILAKYTKQATLSTLVSLVSFGFTNGLPILLLFGYSVKEVGLYFVAARIANAPVTLIASGLSSSFWSEAAALAKVDPLRLRKLYLKIVTLLALISIPLVLGCISAIWILPGILGGENWAHVGVVVAACAPKIAGSFIFSSTNHLIVYDRQGYQLFSDILSVVGSIIVIVASVFYSWPFWLAIFLICISILFSYIIRFSLHLKANSEAIRAFGSL